MLILQAFAHLMHPDLVKALGLGMLEYVPMFIAEIGTGLWLLVRGADVRVISERGGRAPAAGGI